MNEEIIKHYQELGELHSLTHWGIKGMKWGKKKKTKDVSDFGIKDRTTGMESSAVKYAQEQNAARKEAEMLDAEYKELDAERDALPRYRNPLDVKQDVNNSHNLYYGKDMKIPDDVEKNYKNAASNIPPSTGVTVKTGQGVPLTCISVNDKGYSVWGDKSGNSYAVNKTDQLAIQQANKQTINNKLDQVQSDISRNANKQEVNKKRQQVAQANFNKVAEKAKTLPYTNKSTITKTVDKAKDWVSGLFN